MKKGILFRPYSFWVGIHYSPKNRRFCINLIPFVTIWVTLKGGKIPYQCANTITHTKHVNSPIEKSHPLTTGEL